MLRARVLSGAVLLGMASVGFAEQLVLTPLDDAQMDRVQYGDPYVLTNPPPNYRLYMQRQLSSTGEYHEGFLEYSLASLPQNAVVTSASLACRVNLLTNSEASYPSVSIHVFDGGDGQVTYADLSKSIWNVSQSQDLTDLSAYSIEFFSVSPLNDRATVFPSGYLGLMLSPRVEGRQAGIWSDEGATATGAQRPSLTINYTTPEPTSLGVVGLGIIALMRRSR